MSPCLAILSQIQLTQITLKKNSNPPTSSKLHHDFRCPNSFNETQPLITCTPPPQTSLKTPLISKRTLEIHKWVSKKSYPNLAQPQLWRTPQTCCKWWDLDEKWRLGGVWGWGMGGFAMGEWDLKREARVLWVGAAENRVSAWREVFIHIFSVQLGASRCSERSFQCCQHVFSIQRGISHYSE